MQIRLEKLFNGLKLVIRTATKEDATILASWWNNGEIMEHAGFPLGLGVDEEKVKTNTLSKISNTFQLFIIECNDYKIGEMNYKLDGDVANFGVKICETNYQEKGIGKVLLDMLFEHLFIERNCTKICCDTNLNNKRAQYVYEKKMKMTKTKIIYDSFKNQLGELQSAVFYELDKKNYKKIH